MSKEKTPFNDSSASWKNQSEKKLEKVILKNEHLTIECLNFGARWYKTYAKDKNGKMENVMVAIDEQDILKDPTQFGAIVGPIAGRVAHGQVSQSIQLEKNFLGKHNLHSMPNGWDNQFFEVNQRSDVKVLFTYKDKISGFAHEIEVKVCYELKGNAVLLQMSLNSSENTFVNPTNHSYFNLSGDHKRKIDENHELFIHSSAILETTEEQIPTGNLHSVEGTGYDFRTLCDLGVALEKVDGIDDCFVLDEKREDSPDLVLYERENGRKLSIFTDRQAIVCFSTTGFSLPITSNGEAICSQIGLAIEPQEQVDITNHPEWGDISLKKGQTREYLTKYLFEIDSK